MTTYMLVHGACHGGWCWEKVKPLLEARGHKVLAPDLPACGEDRTPIASVTLGSNVDLISGLLDKEPEPVVLVGHSLGGVTVAATSEARRRKIRTAVYVTAILPPSGKAARDMTALEPEGLVRQSYETVVEGVSYTFKRANVPTLFYNECQPEDVYKAMSRLKPQPLKVATTPVTLTDDRFGSVPRLYVECKRDNALPITLQRKMIALTPTKTIKLYTDHSPFFSTPDELAEILHQASLDG